MNLQSTIDTATSAIKSISPRWYRVTRVTWLRRANSSANTMAAAIGFYTLICLAPLALLMVWALQLVMGRGGGGYEWLRATVQRIAGQAAAGIMEQIDALLTNPDSHIAGIFSLLVLIWAGLRLFEALAVSLTEIWPGEEHRGVIGRKLIALASLAGSGVLLLVAALLTALLPTVIDFLGRVPIVDTGRIFFLEPGLYVVVEGAVAFAAFFLLFKFIPASPVPTRAAAVGALFTAVVWRAVTPVFTLTVARSADDSAIYGGLASVVMFLTWAFFSAQILLLGAHFAAAYEHVVTRGRSESLDDSFIHAGPDATVPPEASEDEAEEPFYGPSSYPPPGRV